MSPSGGAGGGVWGVGAGGAAATFRGVGAGGAGGGGSPPEGVRLGSGLVVYVRRGGLTLYSKVYRGGVRHVAAGWMEEGFGRPAVGLAAARGSVRRWLVVWRWRVVVVRGAGRVESSGWAWSRGRADVAMAQRVVRLLQGWS